MLLLSLALGVACAAGLLSGLMRVMRPKRLQRRLAKNPSFWVRNVDFVREYARIHDASFRMTYDYQEIDGRSVRSNS